MRNLYPAFFIFLLFASFVFALDGPPPIDPPPDPVEQPLGAPASIWFEQNETLHYDTGRFSVNWTAVENMSVTNYTVYFLDVPGGNISKAIVRFYFTTVNPSETGIIFGYTAHGVNYSVRIHANNASGSGPNATSDWIYVDKVNPKLSFVPPTPASNSYLMNHTLTILLSADEPIPSILLNWGGTNEQTNITAVGQGGGYYYYYISKILPSEGRYVYYIMAQDRATNSGSTEARAVTYDITSPKIFLTDPKNITYRSTKVPLKYSTYDISPVSCKYEYGSVFTQISNCTNTTFTARDNSTTTVTLWVTDSAGNANFTSVEFAVNTTPLPPPVILSTYPEKGTAVDPTSGFRNTILLSLITDSVAECKYSFVPNITFDGMISRFNKTNSTLHNITIALAPNSKYAYYIRCRAQDGESNVADYALEFRTESLVQIDPYGTMFRNGSLELELIANRAAAFNITVRNMAQYPLMHLLSTVGGTAAPYVNITLPDIIPINSTADMVLFANATKEGRFRADISIKSENLTSNFSATLVVFDDFGYDLNDLKITRRDLSSRLYSLRLKGVNVADSLVFADSLQSEVEDAIALYDSGQYAEARKEYSELTFAMSNLSQSVKSAEAGILFAGKGNSTDSGTTGYTDIADDGAADDGGRSKIFWYSLIGIILVIVAVVIITSILPDDDGLDRELLKPRWSHSNE